MSKPNIKDLATSLVVTPPSPVDSGTSLIITAGDGLRMPITPFVATMSPDGQLPTLDIAEQVTVTDVTINTLTFTRAYGDTTAKDIGVGWRLYAGPIAAHVTGAYDYTDAETTRATTAEALLAPKASPALTGTPTAPTPATGTNTTQIATTAFVEGEIVANATPDATTSVKGKVQLAGDLGGTAASPLVKSRAVSATVSHTSGDYVVSNYSSAVAAINAAITAVNAAGGGIVQLAAETFPSAEMPTAITMKSNVWLRGYGFSTKLQLGSTGGDTLNVQSCTNCRVSDLYIDGTNLATTDGAIIITNSDNITFDNMWVLDSPGPAVKIVDNGGGNHGKITLFRCTFKSGGYDDTVFGGSSDASSTQSEVIISECFISQGNLGHTASICAINLVAQNKYSITNNITEGNITLGGEKIPHIHTSVHGNIVRPSVSYTTGSIEVLTASNAGQTASSKYISITDNQVIGGRIFVQGQAATSSPTDSVIIADNNIEGINSTGTGRDNGIDVELANNVLVANNVVNGSLIGLYMYAVNGGTINGNAFPNCTTPLQFGNSAGACSGILQGANYNINSDNSLQLIAGSAMVDTNQAPGGLSLKTGTGTGNSTAGFISFYTSADTSSGTTLQQLTERMRLTSSLNGRLIIGNNCAGVPSVDGISMKGDVDRTIQVARNTTASTAGKFLKLISGGAVSQGSNLNAGTVFVSTGISTGSGTGQIQLQTAVANTNTLTALASLSINNGGSGYTAADILTITGGGGTAGTATVSTVAVAGAIRTATLNSKGAGYTNGDVLTVTGGGGTSGTITVSTTTLAGGILIFTVSAAGSSYALTTGATTSGGTGTGATINITAIRAVGEITAISLTAAGSGYAVTTGAATTGGSGTGATLNLVTYAGTDNAAVTQMTVQPGSIDVANNKITSLANGTTSTDAAAFGQIPTSLPPNGSAGGDLAGTYPSPTLATAGTSGTYAYPSSVTTDTKGRVTGVVANTSTGSGPAVLQTGSTISTPIVDQINDTNGKIELSFTTTASAVNGFNITNSATGIAPSMTPSGSDTNIGYLRRSKGTGADVWRPGSDSTSTVQWKTSGNTTFASLDSTNQRFAIGQLGVPTSTLQSAGSFATNLVTKSTAYTATATDSTVLVSGTTTITLPTAVGIVGRIYTIKKTDTGTTSTVATTSSQNIDGATTYSLSAQYKYVTVQSDGTQWWVIANN